MPQTHNCSRRFTLENLDIRGQLVQLDSVWKAIHRGRQYPYDLQQILGELIAVAVLVGAGLKQPGRAALQIQQKHVDETYAAPLAVVDCTDALGVRGMLHTNDAADEKKTSFAEWVDGGTLAMTLTYENSNQVYQSIVPISGLSVAECFEHYFDQSEQLPTHLWIAANDRGVGALLLQKLPNADLKDADGWARVEQLAASVTAAELIDLPAAPLLGRLFAKENVRLYEPKAVTCACKRDVQKVENMLRSLGREEVDATLAELGEIIVKDDICNEEYRFGAADVARVFGEA